MAKILFLFSLICFLHGHAMHLSSEFSDPYSSPRFEQLKTPKDDSFDDDASALDDLKKATQKKELCFHCNQSYACLRKHLVQIKIMNKSPSCVECGSVFKTSSLLLGHQVDYPTEHFSCVYCFKIYKDETKLNNHHLTHRPATQRSAYICECTRKFTTKRGFSLHRNRCSVARPFLDND